MEQLVKFPDRHTTVNVQMVIPEASVRKRHALTLIVKMEELVRFPDLHTTVNAQIVTRVNIARLARESVRKLSLVLNPKKKKACHTKC